MVERNELYWLNAVCCFRTRAASRLKQPFWSTPHSGGHKQQNLRECACVSFVWNNNDTRIKVVIRGKESFLKKEGKEQADQKTRAFFIIPMVRPITDRTTFSFSLSSSHTHSH